MYNPAISLIAALFLALTFGPLGAETSQVNASKLLTKGAAGPFRVGMKVEAVKVLIDQQKIKVVDLESEGLFTPAIVIASGSLGELAWNSNNEWAIDRLDVSDPTYYTAKGIHVGSTFSDVKRRYPSTKVSKEEGAHLIDEEAAISFNMSGYSGTSVVESIVLSKKR